jgi:hypothetical protein
MHATSKHGSTLEECFPGADKVAAEMVAATQKPKGDNGGGGGATKVEKKKKNNAGMGD